MGLRSLKAHFQVILGGFVLLAAALLIILNLANGALFSLYGKNIGAVSGGEIAGGVSTGVLMLFSAIGGVLLWYVGRLFVHGAMQIWRQRRQQARMQREVEKRSTAQSGGASAPAGKQASTHTSSAGSSSGEAPS